jgi:hypothetical protein
MAVADYSGSGVYAAKPFSEHSVVFIERLGTTGNLQFGCSLYRKEWERACKILQGAALPNCLPGWRMEQDWARHPLISSVDATEARDTEAREDEEPS